MRISRPLRLVTLLSCIFVLSYPRPATGQSDTVAFVHITDTHLIFGLDDYQPDIVRLRKHYGNGIEPLTKMLDSLSTSKSTRFAAITGDMIDFYGATDVNAGEQVYQIERFARLIGNYSLPVFLNLGNHDIASYAWNGERMTSSQRIAGKARAAWIRSAPAFSEGTYYSRLLSAGGTQYRLIFLDNGYNSAGELEKSKPPYLDRIQLEWLKEQLNESKEDVEIVLMHIPFGKDTAGSELYDILSGHPSLRLILSGHNHENLIRHLGPENKLVQVQTGAFARNPHEWREIKLTAKSILVSFPGARRTEAAIPLAAQ